MRNLFLLCLSIFAFQVKGQDESSQRALESRRALAESGQFLQAVEPVGPTGAAALAEAMDIEGTQVINATLSGSLNATLVASGLGVIHPRQGSSFALLSTGVAGTSAPEPGVDFGAGGTQDDAVHLSLEISVPEGSNRLSFDFNFFSAEYPDFIGSQFNDTFAAYITDDNGTRQVAFASVNSSFFFPASNQVASGSGFDIFTADPSGVDTEFGVGLPDAGLTGFTSVSASFTSSTGIIHLDYYISDLGDGILDSAVLIDNVSFANFSLIDPNPDFVVNGEVTTDTDLLSEGGRVIRGAATDGVTPVMLRAELAGPGMVTFTMQGNAGEDGSISELGTSGSNQSVTVPVILTNNGYRAFAVYRVPETFNRGGDENEIERSITIQADYLDNQGNTVTNELPLRLVRPPLVFVHGLWSSSKTWSFPLISDPRWEGSIEFVNYQATNASYFHINSGEIPAGIKSALRNMRVRETAATQVDVLGHSMGGLLGRIWVDNYDYLENANFFQGDINRLITLNTPHTGSPLGNLAVTLRELPLVGGLISSAANALGHPIDQGALDDLSVGSAALDAIPETPVPSHAMVGTGGSGALSSAPGFLGDFYSMVEFFAPTSDLFQGLQHDFIVGRNSQEGGIATSAQSIFGGNDSIHIFCTASQNYSDSLENLLNSSPSSSSFSFFPDSFPISPSPPLLARARDQGLVSAGLTIEVDVVNAPPGDQINVTAAPLPGVNVDRVLFIGPDEAIEITAPPFLATLTIPEDFVGTYTVTAIGTNMDEDYYTSPEVTVQVETTVPIDAVKIFPTSPIIKGEGSTRAIQVVGRYNDGVTRDITTHASTIFLVNDPSIFSVDANGVITAVSEGISTLIAINGNVQDSVTVTILPECSVSPVFLARVPNWGQTETILTLIPFASCQ